jgi:peptide/nickel transport system ATP-binding protein
MTAVKGASFVLHAGEVLALVGESGSGKSSLARALAGLLPPSSGEILLGSEPVARLAGQRRPEQRRRLQLIFQNPDASLNPRRRVGAILASALRSFEGRRPKRLEARIAQALSEVRLPATYRDRFPDQLSGGERQRVAIARALIVDPEVLVCDEVLSALDVSVQAAILDLLRELCRNRNLAVLFISHDLAVVRSIAQRILVMFRGEIMSSTTAEGLLTPPLHPYVHELLSAIPGERIARPPPPFAHGGSGADGGCPFVIRCPVAIPRICRGIPPPLRGDGLRCHHEPAELRRLLPIEEGAESASPVHSVPRSLSFGMSAP